MAEFLEPLQQLGRKDGTNLPQGTTARTCVAIGRYQSERLVETERLDPEAELFVQPLPGKPAPLPSCEVGVLNR